MSFIALDIDGTITKERNFIPQPVLSFLEEVAKEHMLMFITGRSYAFALPMVQNLTFPFFWASQNGAMIFQMPKKTLVYKQYLTPEDLLSVEEASNTYHCSFVLYTGFEGIEDYFKTPLLDKESVRNIIEPPVKPLKEIHLFDKVSNVSLVKCTGPYAVLQEVQAFLQKKQLSCFLISHPFVEECYFLLVTHQDVDKGKAIKNLLSLQNKSNMQIIAAGNDQNDLPLLEAAHIRIVMEDAPKNLLQKATIVAPAAEKFGIIQALQQALQLTNVNS
jgi:hypothetical protein